MSYLFYLRKVRGRFFEAIISLFACFNLFLISSTLGLDVSVLSWNYVSLVFGVFGSQFVPERSVVVGASFSIVRLKFTEHFRLGASLVNSFVLLHSPRFVGPLLLVSFLVD